MTPHQEPRVKINSAITRESKAILPVEGFLDVFISKTISYGTHLEHVYNIIHQNYFNSENYKHRIGGYRIFGFASKAVYNLFNS